VLEKIWAGLGELAGTLGVQVFATTHSRECIEAAHSAFAQRSSYDFGVIQLYRLETGVEGRLLDRRLIEAAMDGDIDLR